MGDYSATIQKLGAANDQATATATGADMPPVDAPAPDGPYADTIRLLGDARKQAARLSVVAAQGANPDAAARAAQLAPEVGAPAAAVEQDLPAFEQQAQTQRNAAIVGRNPILAGWLAANPEAARIAKDDFDKLNGLSKAWTALSSGWSEAFLSNERGRLGNLVQLGSTDTAVPGKIAGIEDKLAAQPHLSGVYGTLQKTSGFAGGLLDNFLHAVPQGAQGLTLGAATGAAGGAVAGGVGAIPGAAAGGTVGALTGFGVGFKWDMARTAAGNTYLNLGKVTGADGQPIDEAAKQVASVLVGVGTYALAGVGVGAVKKEATDAASKFLSDAVQKAVTQPTVARAFALAGQKLAKSGMEGALLNAGMEGVNIFGEEAAKFMSAGQFDTVFNDPLQRQQALDRLMASAVDGAMLFPIMKLPFVGASFVGDSLRARQAQSDMALFQGLEQGAASSKVRGRSLQAFQDFLQRQSQGSPVENLFIPGERVRELYQSMGREPGDEDDPFAFVPDMKKQIEQAKATGGDVVVPTADYVAHLAGTPLADELRPDIRVRQDGMSAREAAEFEKHRAALLADNAVSLRTQMDDELRASEPAQQVNGDMFSKLRAAGYTVDAARQYAALVAARYATRSERLGGAKGSALDLYKAEGVDVRRVLPPSLAHIPVDETDMVINAVRDGSKLPSDKDLFGPSLIDFIKGRGGAIDDGGELKALDADKVRGLVKKRAKDEIGHARSLDALALAAWEHGYFPEHTERPEIGDLTEAIRAELAGQKRYAGGSESDVRASFKSAVSDMDQFLNEKGIDAKTASNAEVKAALREHQETEGRSFDQPAFHGSPHIFDRFDSSKIGNGQGAQAFGHGLYFAGKKEIAEHYRKELSRVIKVGGKELDKAEPGADKLLAAGGDIIRAIKEAEADVLDAPNERALARREEVVRSLYAMKKEGVTVGQGGRLYHVELAPKDEELLDWDKPLSEQSATVRAALAKLGIKHDPELLEEAKRQQDAAFDRWHALLKEKGDDDPAVTAARADFKAAQRDSDALNAAAAYKGEQAYRSLGSKSSDARASELLAQNGVRGITYRDNSSRGLRILSPEESTSGKWVVGIAPNGPNEYFDNEAAARAAFKAKDTRNYVIFNDRDVSIQSYEQAERGKITLDNGKAVISLFRDADLSTFLHESGHLWLDEMVRDAADAAAPPELHDDMAAILKWLKVESPDQIGTEQHEQFARGFEAYLMEGRAPSLSLGAAFRKFKTWLVSIYKSVAGLNVPMNDQIRGVMDRMLATEHEIASARRAEGLNPLFPDAKSAGMTDAEYKAYTQGIKKAQGQADERLLGKAMAAIRRTRTAAWKEESAAMREDVGREVRSRPDLRAQHFLRTGKLLDAPDEQAPIGRVRMSRDALKDMYGNDEAPGLLPKGTYANKGGIHPDELADLFGYRSGDEMVKALMSLEATRKNAEARTGKALDGARYVAHLIDSETEARMLERHGDALSDGSIEEEALAAVHNQAQADIMATELRMLARKAAARGEREEPPLSVDDIRSWVRSEIADMKVDRGTDAAGFNRAEAKSSREVERALLKGDIRAAFQAKQRQLVNHLLGIEADTAREEYQDGQKLFERYASKPTFAGIDQAYTDRIHELLKRFGYQTKRSDAELQGGLGGQTLEGFVGAKESEGRELVVPTFLLDDRFAKPIDELTVDEFMGLKDAITSLAHNGRDEKMITVDGKRMEFEGLVGEAVEKLSTMPQKKAPKEINPGTAAGFRGTLERLTSLMRNADAGLLKQEQVFDWLDGRDPNGVFNRVVFRRLKEAQHRENDRLADITGRVRALGDAMPKGWQKGLDQRMEIPELRNRATGEPYVFRKKDILALALNTGNDGNFDKLVKGYGWSREAVKAVLNRTMKKEDWDFVQGIWDTFESLYPDIEAMTRRITGVGPEKVAAVPVETAHGTYRGGYYPVVYDPLKSHAAELRSQRNAQSMFENNYFRATTPKGHTLARVENYAAPIRLSLDIIPWKLGQAVHDLSFREAIMDADKFLKDKRIMGAVDGALGHEYTLQFRKWLQSIANDRNIDEKGLAGMDWLARQARINTTMVGVGFRVSTMMKHGMTALSNSIGEIGGRAMVRGSAEFFGSPEKMRRQWDYAIERSGELRHRMNQIDRDVREGLRTLEGETGWRASAERYSHYGVAMLDMASAMPTWFGAYRKALDGGALEQDAIYAADKAVRNAHGAQGVTDIAQIQRGGEVAKLFTMFYGFFNHIYNRQRDTLRTAGQGVDKFKAGDYAGARRDFAMVLARSVYYLIVPALTEALVSQGGPDQDKDETWGGWAAKAILGELPAGIPLLRDAAKAAIDGRSYEMSPVGKAVETAIAAGKDVGSALGLRGDKEVSSRWVKHAVETPGYVLGLPTGQAAGSAQYLWDVWDQDTAPEGIADFMRGVMYGPAPKKP